MHEDFQLPVVYKGKELSFTARLLHLGYIYKIEVEVFNTVFHFERDDEGNWRILLKQPEMQPEKAVDRELLEQLLVSIDKITG